MHTVTVEYPEPPKPQEPKAQPKKLTDVVWAWLTGDNPDADGWECSRQEALEGGFL
jgi:hypothetical protein